MNGVSTVRPLSREGGASAPSPALSWAWLKGRVVALGGWRRFALAAGLGVLAAAALPPLHVLVLLVPAFTGLVWLMGGAGHRRGVFAVGWWFGFGHFLAGLYWLTFAFMVDAERYAWMAPFAVLGLSAFIALFVACAVLLTHVAARGGAGRILVLAAAWTAVEWVRGWVLTGFPWNLMGTVWVVSDAMIQAAALCGVLGLSLITVAAAAMPAVLAEGRGGRAVIVAFAVLAAMWGGGQIRLGGADAGTVEGVRLRLVQPNIPQKLKWRRELRLRHVVHQMRMATEPAAPGAAAPTHIVWAETAVPFFLDGDAKRLAMIGTATPEGGLTITGAPRSTRSEDGRLRVWNSLHAIDPGGRVVATYDKFHLVPFGEYVPLRAFLRIARLAPGGTDFSPGPGPRTLRLPGLPPVSPLICYEVVFAGRVMDDDDRPAWLLNVTNDGWYGRSSGPYQHFAAARLRAVEEGLPLVRVANTGISAVIDAYGRTVAGLALGREGILDSDLPAALAGGTVYGRFGDWTALVLVVAAALAGVLLSQSPPNHR